MFWLFSLFLAGITIQLEDGAVVVRGITRPGAVAVYVEGKEHLPALAGSQQQRPGEVRFVPRFPLQPGLSYRAVYGQISAILSIPKVERKPTARVEHIYPTADRLPSNQLKLYLHFSEPMSKGEAWRRVHLVDDEGQTVAGPFLEIEEELWDPSMRRLTVLFDPGRIKRGLVPHNEMGPALVEGRRYHIVIDQDWPDANGTRLAAAYRKTFVVAEADRTPPQLDTWRIQSPRAGTRDPLTVSFPEPLDAALLQRLLRVADTPGNVSLHQAETEWRFTPDAPWKPGPQRLLIGSIVEDLAGNRIGRKFDVDAFEKVEMRMTIQTLELPFQVQP